MRNHRSIILIALTLIPALAMVGNVGSAPATATQILTANSLLTQSGSMSGSLTATHILDSNGSADNSDNYITFSATKNTYYGYQTFQLTPNIRMELVSTFLFQVNIKVPINNTQVWTWSIYDWNTQMWQKVGDTIGSKPGEWTNLTFRVKPLLRYISPSREIRVQFKSNNVTEGIKLDYEAFHVTYIPVAPTSTRSVGTSIPTKGVFVLPTTITPSPTSTPTNTPSPTNTPLATNTPVCATLNSTFESQVLTLLNQERTNRGIPALKSNTKLRNAALGHTQDMACNNFIGHLGSDGSDPGDRITAAGYDYSTWGENVAAGYTSPSSVVDAWMDSTGHRANILNPSFTEIGIGYVYNSASTYGHYWTTDFGAP